MERSKTARNVAIVAALAAAVYFLPGGGRAASTAEALLMVGFGVAFGYIGLRMYRERRVSIHGLGDRYRALLYGAVAGGFFAAVGYKRMWETGLGELLWFVLVGLVVYAVVVVVRYARRY